MNSILHHTKKFKKENKYKYNHNYNHNYNHSIYKCRKCKIGYNNEIDLNVHSYIHINPIYYYYPYSGINFLPNYQYQYQINNDSNDSNINIKCKFCDNYSSTYALNTLHMEVNHNKDYNIYMQKINEFNEDNNCLDISQIKRLTTNYLQDVDFQNKDDKEDLELKYIENNKCNNLDLFADIALMYIKK